MNKNPLRYLLPAVLSHYFQQRGSLRELRSPLSSTVDEHLNKSCLSGFSARKKKELRDAVVSEVAEVLAANEGFMVVLRQKILGAAFTYANLQVLALKESEKAPPLRDGPYLSGELHHKIAEAVPFNEELKEFAWKGNPTAAQLVDFCNVRSVIMAMHLNCFNVLRVLFKDIDRSKDWFRPFVKSMLIWAEDSQRKNLGLPSLLADDLDGLRFSLFGNFVGIGSPDPYLAWATCDTVKRRKLDLSAALTHPT